MAVRSKRGEGGLSGRSVVVAVTGGIAAYKSCELVRRLVAAGAEVHVVMSRAAQAFVTPLTFQTLSRNPVLTDLFSLSERSEIQHVRLARTCDAVVVAPATAHFLARAARGMADDLPTTIALATRSPILLAPAMNDGMWGHPATRENVKRLEGFGCRIVGPETGFLAEGYEARGRMAEPPAILEALERLLAPRDLAGERVLVTAGPTREPIDPVRFLSNRSSGRMGYAIARAARARGAEVRLVTGPTAIDPPAGVEVVRVTTAEEMRRGVRAFLPRATVVIMAAAVADFRPKTEAVRKIKKSGKGTLSLDLTATPDILSEIGRAAGRRILVGFAAETDHLLEHAAAKLRGKKLDLLVANDVSRPDSGFDGASNQVVLLRPGRPPRELPLLPKDEVAAKILDEVVQIRG